MATEEQVVRVAEDDNRIRIVLAILLAVAFGGVAISLPPHGGTTTDRAIALWIAAHTSDTGLLMATWLSWLGDTALAGLVLAAAVLLATKRHHAIAAVIVLTSVSAPLLDILLKQVFHRGRPDYAVEFITGPTWSFPSGHAMSTLAGYGIILYFRVRFEHRPWKRTVMIAGGSALIFAIACSRLYLGVHYATDVLGGLLLGGTWLLLAIEGYDHSLRTMRAARRAVP